VTAPFTKSPTASSAPPAPTSASPSSPRLRQRLCPQPQPTDEYRTDADIRHVDVGVVRDEKGRERYFVNTLGLGFSGAVALESRRIRRLQGLMLYGLAFLRALVFRYACPTMEVFFDDVKRTAPTLSLTVAIGRREGSFVVAPTLASTTACSIIFMPGRCRAGKCCVSCRSWPRAASCRRSRDLAGPLPRGPSAFRSAAHRPPRRRVLQPAGRQCPRARHPHPARGFADQDDRETRIRIRTRSGRASPCRARRPCRRRCGRCGRCGRYGRPPPRHARRSPRR